VPTATPPPDGKVTVCHKGKHTIEISAEAVEAHLDHGDTLGACDRSDEKQHKHKKGKGKKNKHRGNGDHDDDDHGKHKGNGNGKGKGRD
jgi:hypothetical protein